MNNNPYNYYYPYTNMVRNIPTGNYTRAIPNMYQGLANVPTRSAGLLSRLFGGGASVAPTIAGATSSGITFSGILSGASKTLGVINQAIPVFYQVKPIWNNAKTMFRVAKAMNSSDTTSTSNTNIKKSESTTNTIKNQNNDPTFFN